MKIGLVGFAGSGKTTVFNALTGLHAEVGGYSAREKANIGVIKVPDSRVDRLAEMFNPRKTTYAEISFVDPAGPGAEESATGHSGLDPKLVQHMRDVDALVHVVRSFENPALVQPPDPARDIRAFDDELILTDLLQIEGRMARIRKERDAGREGEVLERLRAELEREQPLRDCDLDAGERMLIQGFRFLSRKPLLLLINVEESDPSAGAPAIEAAGEKGLDSIVLSARLEMEVSQLPPPEQDEFLKEMGVEESARGRFIRAAYRSLNLISFMTTGEDECRAWPIRRGLTAHKAAGRIHSDMERGFIRAEVVRFEDLLACGSEARCREQGKLRLEGKDYVVQDGDVIHFRFNV